ncbi:MAG: FAD-dependent oxidoreductase, partial [Clostridia bacterium]
MKKIIIIGGGASGILTAILLAQRFGGQNVLVIEGNDRILKKLALTGN